VRLDAHGTSSSSSVRLSDGNIGVN
jgi:hypothetical protein